MKELTSTSYAILGLLSVRRWSAYDLAKQMKRSMAYYWPRAERAIYAEPKNLVAHGLATATVEASGKRTRSVYAITPKGRRALSRWLAQPSAAPQFESEAIVRVLFAENGSTDDLLAAIRGLRAHAGTLRAEAVEVARGYVEGRGPFPHRVHLAALTGQFIIDYVRTLERWSLWAETEVERWPNTTDPAVFPGSLDVFRGLLEEEPDSATPTRTATG